MFNLFDDNAVGISISDRYIRSAYIKKTKNGKVAEALGSAILSDGVIHRGEISNRELLSKGILDSLNNAKPAPIETNSIILGLSEDSVFIHRFHVSSSDLDKNVKKKEALRELIYKEALENIPLDQSDLVYSHSITEIKAKNGDEAGLTYDCIVTATSKKTIDKWQSLFNKLGLHIEYFEAEPIAIMRGLYDTLPEKPVLIIDFKSVLTRIYIFNREGVAYSYSFEKSGGKLSEREGSGVEESVKQLLREVETGLGYYQNREGDKVYEIVLIGNIGEATQLKNLLSEKFGLPVNMGSSLFRSKVQSSEHIEAIGLGAGKFDEKARTLRLFGDIEKDTEKRVPRDETSIKDIENHKIIPHKRQKVLVIILAILLLILVTVVILKFMIKDRETIPDQSFNLTENLDKELQNETPEGMLGVTESSDIVVLQILETPTGWLNVRTGPGTDNDQIGRIFPEEAYNFLDKNHAGDWYKIELGTGEEGWISAEYASVIEGTLP